MKLQAYICDNRHQWDSFVDLSPQGNIFCRTPFLESLDKEYDIVIVEENNQAMMGAIILKHNNKPIKAPYPFTMYHGMLFDKSFSHMPNHRRVHKERDLTEFLLEYMAKNYSRISFCLHYNFDDLRSLQWFNYHEPNKNHFLITLRYTGILELSAWKDFDHYLQSIRTVRRQEYNKFKSSNFTLELSNDLDMLDQLHKKTFERQGIDRPAEEVRLLRSITRGALDKGYGQLLMCRNTEGAVMSAIVFLYDRWCGYYMFGANDPEYRKTGCGTYLLLENIRQCKEKGLSKVDMVGINSPQRGDFKTSFNAKPVPYFIVDWPKPV